MRKREGKQTKEKEGGLRNEQDTAGTIAKRNTTTTRNEPHKTKDGRSQSVIGGSARTSPKEDTSSGREWSTR